MPKPNVCTPKDPPTAHTSCVIELYDGAPACGGADLISEFVVLLVVDVDSDPDSYVVVVVESYQPSIAVLDPETLVCVVSGYAGTNKANRTNNIINIPVK